VKKPKIASVSLGEAKFAAQKKEPGRLTPRLDLPRL
jgi:hypothetical protein